MKEPDGAEPTPMLLDHPEPLLGPLLSADKGGGDELEFPPALAAAGDHDRENDGSMKPRIADEDGGSINVLVRL